jgi:elongator complex protein 3
MSTNNIKANIFEGISTNELFVRCVNEIVAQLVLSQQQGTNVNLNRLKCDVASKYGLKKQPKLVDIIGAVPPHFKVEE